MRDYSIAIQQAIPDNIRLGEHSDAKLIAGLLARIVVCTEENDSVWRKNRMKCIHDTVARWNEEEFIPHITKEDEDWNSLKAQIAQNEAELASLRPAPTPPQRPADEAVARLDGASSRDEALAILEEYVPHYEAMTKEERARVHLAFTRHAMEPRQA